MTPNWSQMSMSDPLNHLVSIWYYSEPSDIPYSPNQFLALDFFCHFLQQDGSSPVAAKIHYSFSLGLMEFAYMTQYRSIQITVETSSMYVSKEANIQYQQEG